MTPFDKAWTFLKAPMVDGSLERRDTWQDNEGDENVRYVADFKHPETGEMHPMVADINHAETDTMYGRFSHPMINMNILPPNHDVGDVPKNRMFSEEDSYRHSIAEASFRPQESDNNFANRNMIGMPRVKDAGPMRRMKGFEDWKEDNPEHSDISLMDYMIMLDNYKHQGHGTAMYDMAADVLDRETRGGHVIVRDDDQTNNAERMWAKHKHRSNWPHRGQR
jgi:hypothetical protein